MRKTYCWIEVGMKVYCEYVWLEIIGSLWFGINLLSRKSATLFRKDSVACQGATVLIKSRRSKNYRRMKKSNLGSGIWDGPSRMEMNMHWRWLDFQLYLELSGRQSLESGSLFLLCRDYRLRNNVGGGHFCLLKQRAWFSWEGYHAFQRLQCLDFILTFKWQNMWFFM